MSNLFTETREVIKRDYFGVFYKTSVLGKKEKDLGDLWRTFIDSQKPLEEHYKSLEGNGDFNSPNMEREETKLLIEKNII